MGTGKRSSAVRAGTAAGFEKGDRVRIADWVLFDEMGPVENIAHLEGDSGTILGIDNDIAWVQFDSDGKMYPVDVDNLKWSGKRESSISSSVSRGHKLLTKALEKKLPSLYSQENVEDPVAQIKFFDPMSRWTWYGIEYDPEQRLFFGYVKSGLDPNFDELGYFSLDELESTSNSLGLPLERDMYYQPQNLSDIKREAKEEIEMVEKSRSQVRRPGAMSNIKTDNISSGKNVDGEVPQSIEYISRLKGQGMQVSTKMSTLSNRWMTARKDGLTAQILYFDKPSEFGIKGRGRKEGRISKLWINDGKKVVAEYDRGWSIRPPSEGPAREMFDQIVEASR
jgi:hypothetical protein